MGGQRIANGLTISNGGVGSLCLRCFVRRATLQQRLLYKSASPDPLVSDAQIRSIASQSKSPWANPPSRKPSPKPSKKKVKQAEEQSYLFFYNDGPIPSPETQDSEASVVSAFYAKRLFFPLKDRPDEKSSASTEKQGRAEGNVSAPARKTRDSGGRRKGKIGKIKHTPSGKKKIPIRKIDPQLSPATTYRRPQVPMVANGLQKRGPTAKADLLSMQDVLSIQGRTFRMKVGRLGKARPASTKSSGSDDQRLLGETLKESLIRPVPQQKAETAEKFTAPDEQIPKLKKDDIGLESNTQLEASKVQLEAVDVEMPPVPRLAHGLDRVLFNRGVYQFRDLHSRVYNFNPALEMITPTNHIDFNSLKGFIPTSGDSTLADIALKHGKKYIGSTSSMTGALKHLHFLLSKFRVLNMGMLSTKVRGELPAQFTAITMAPESIFLKRRNGVYAIDQNKEFSFSNVLSYMGRYMEKLLTVDLETFARHKKGQPNPITEEEREADLSHHYSSVGDILMRSQLDAYDPRLPGTGTFDVKTRAVIPIRMESKDPGPMLGYELIDTLGLWASYEREYADMMRSVLLKYSLQARIGRMDGIFVAYHNIIRLFGFQYLSINEMDLALHGQQDRTLGDCEFRYSAHLMNKILDEATAKFPEQPLRIYFETRKAGVRSPVTLNIFAEPTTEEEMLEAQRRAEEKLEAWEHWFLNADLTAPPPTTSAEESVDSLAKDTPLAPTNEPDVEDAVADPEVEPNIEPFPNESVEYPAADPPATPAQEVLSNEVAAALETIEPDDPPQPAPTTTPKKEILHLRLRISSTQAGTPVLRPDALSDADDWKMEYSLAANANQTQAWREYEACKRRKAALEDDDPADRDDDRNPFWRRLKEEVKQGIAWRRQRDARDAADEERRGGVLVWDSDEPVPAPRTQA